MLSILLLKPQVSVTQGCRWWAWLAARGRHTLSCCDVEQYRCACLHWGWLGVVMGISAASNGGILVIY